MRAAPRRLLAATLSVALILTSPGTAAVRAFAEGLPVSGFRPVVNGVGAVPVVAPHPAGSGGYVESAGVLQPGGLIGGQALQGLPRPARPPTAIHGEMLPLLPAETPYDIGRESPAPRDRVAGAPGGRLLPDLPVSAGLRRTEAAVYEVAEALAPGKGAPETVRDAGRRLFEKSGPARPEPPEGAVSVPLSGAAKRPPAFTATGVAPRPSMPPSPQRIGEGRRSWAVRAADYVAVNPRSAVLGAIAGLLGLALLTPDLGLSAGVLAFCVGTCSSMQQQARKNAVLLPNPADKERQEAAKTELDAILVAFGKKLKSVADEDPRVTTAADAHRAEHAAEEPVIGRLEALRKRWTEGGDPATAEELEALKGAILAELKRTTLSEETPELIRELFEKTGFWDEFLSWEKKHEILESLKKEAQKQRGETDGKVAVPKPAEGSQGGISSGGLKTLLLFFMTALGGSFTEIVSTVGYWARFSFVTEPTPPPVPLDAFLALTGLDAEEIEFLKSFTSDIGARDFAPVIGRTKEIQQAITILSAPPGTQNNPMLLGDKGVGKTAIVEGVARYLVENRLPSLKGRRILELDAGKLAAGTKFQGEMEERLTKLRETLAKTRNKVILFVDEVHTLLKNSSTGNAVPDLLKAPLRNGEITMIGATTLGEFRKYVETDPAFADRFETVDVAEPTVEEAIEMLEGDREYLERKFGAGIDPEAVEAAVRLSARFVPEKFLPRKGWLLLKRAIGQANAAVARDGLQVRIDQLTDKLRLTLKRYAALKAKGDPGAAARTREIQLFNDIVAAYQTLVSLEERQKAILERRVTRDDVVRALASDTGLDVGELGDDEYQRLLRMEPWFRERIVGQNEAVSAIADVVRTNKAGLSDPRRPLGTFLFAGKTGVGKTELVKTLAEFLFNDKDSVIRLDMSEYMEKFSVQRLFGAPPGFVGYDQGGELTEKVRRKPYSVILLDEIEKAHPDVLNALLQVLEDGRMTDGRGNTVNFKNAIIVMTTNIGSGSDASGDVFRREVVAAIEATLRREFVNRIDKVIVFNPLEMSQAEQIVRIMLRDVQKRLQDQDLRLDVSDEAVLWVAGMGFDARYGARPLKRTVESQVSKALGVFLLKKKSEGVLVNGGVVKVGVADGAIAFELVPDPPPAVELAPLPEGPLGEKLRRILEEALRPGSKLTGDLRSFEAVLFPDRIAVELKESMGGFQPQTPGGTGATQSGRNLEPGPPGRKDPALQEFKAALREELDARENDARAPEALEAWLEAFTRLAREFVAPEAADGAEEPLRVDRRLPLDGGEASVAIEFVTDGDYAKTQRLLRRLKDNLSEPVADEAAVRARAGALKDAGVEPDLNLLQAKRLVESIPGATYGFSETGGRWTFWLKLPVGPAPSPAPTAPQAAPKPAEGPFQADRSPKVSARTISLHLGNSSGERNDQDPGAMKFRDDARAKGLPLMADAAWPAVDRWIFDLLNVARAYNDGGERIALRGRADSSADGFVTLSIETDLDPERRENIEEYLGDHFSVIPSPDSDDEVRATLRGRGQEPDERLLELNRMLRAVPGARFGYSIEEPEEDEEGRRDEEAAPELTLWLQVPRNARPADYGIYRPAAPEPAGARLGQEGATRATQAQLDRIFAVLAAAAYPLLADAETGDAVKRWLGAFGPVALELSRDGSPLTASVSRNEKDGTVTVTLASSYDAAMESEKLILEMLREHFVRDTVGPEQSLQAAAELREKGVDGNAELLDLKRDLRSLGATFGHTDPDAGAGEAGPKIRFWLSLRPKAASGTPFITAADARANPSKRLLYLTLGYPADLDPLRSLAADLLSAQSVSNRLLGLHIAGALLPPGAFGDLLAATSLVRVGLQNDHALLADLLKNLAPGGAAGAGRETIREAFRMMLDDLLRKLAGDRDMESEALGGLALYARLSAEADGADDEQASRELVAKIERPVWRLRRNWALVVTASVLAASLGVAGVFFLGPVGAWVGLNLAGATWLKVGAGIASVAALITIWSWFASANGTPIRRLPAYLPTLRAVLLPTLAPREAARTARRLFDRTLGRFELGDRGVSWDQMAGLLGTGLSAMDEKARRGAWAAWRGRLEAAFARDRESRLRERDRREIGSLALAGRMARWVPQDERAAWTNLMLEPLRRRWLPDPEEPYGKALGAWLSEEEVPPAALEEALQLIGRLVETNGSGSQGRGFEAALRGIAARRDLPDDMRPVLEELLQALERRFQIPEEEKGLRAATLAALAPPDERWKNLRKVVESPIDSTRRRVRLGSALPVIERLLRDSPPAAEDAAWLRRTLADAMRADDASAGVAALAAGFAASTGAEALEWRLKAVRAAEIPSRGGPDHGLLLEGLRGSVRAAAAEAEKQEPGKLAKTAQTNLTRLTGR